MKIGPITLFKRRHSNGEPAPSFTIASLHWRDSITWRWSVAVSWGGYLGKRFASFQRIYRAQGFNFWLTVRLPFGCALHVDKQPNMWQKRRSKVPPRPIPRPVPDYPPPDKGIVKK